MAADKPIWNYVLPLIAFFVLGSMWYLGDGSLFEGAKQAFEFAYENYVPDITVGERSLKSGKTTLEGSTLESADSLKATLTALSDPKTGKNCFARYAPFTTDMGDNAGTAMFQFDYDDTHDLTHVIIWKRKDVVASKFDVPKMKPCVIAGREGNIEIAKNFRQAIERGDINKATIPYTYTVDTLHIQYSQNYRNGNRIFIDQLARGAAPDPEVVNDESKNFEEGGLIFKGPDNELCFFPTNWIKDADEDGLNNDYVQELGNKFDNGDPSVPQCHLEKGFDAITLTSNMESSSNRNTLECKSTKTNLPLDSNSKRVQLTNTHQYFKGLSTSCSFLLPTEKPNQGCLALIQNPQYSTTQGCASTVVQEGEVIPSTNAEYGLKPYLNNPSFASPSAYCAISQGEWFTQNENSLLCANTNWNECSKESLNNEITVAVNQKPVIYQCTTDGDHYSWTKKSGDLNFAQYRGIEIAGRALGAYPLGCDSEFNIINSKCDLNGIMGVTSPSSKTGTFICPSYKGICNDESEFPSMDQLSPEGCQVFISADLYSNNNCARALIPFGTVLSKNHETSLYNCGDQPNCPFGPIEVNLPEAQDNNLAVGCLLNHQWTLPETEQGDLLCSKAFNDQDGVWNECNQRVVGRCLTTQTPTGPKQFCCNLNKGENTFRFIETPKVSSE